jgi:tetratricopeptide (TPR) repeat protein
VRQLRVVCRAAAVALAMAALGLVGGCAPKSAVPAAPTTPRYGDYPFPAVPDGVQAPADVVRAHESAWRTLQAGNVRGAERAFAAVIKQRPQFYPAVAGAGFAALARQDGRTALVSFERALAANADYVPALVGKGEALTAQGRDADALDAFLAALTVDGSLGEVRRRVEVLRFRAVEARLTEARAAEAASDWEAARAAYERALAVSPDSALVQRQLASVERRLGDRVAALAHATASADLDPNDLDVWLLIADLQQEAGNAPAAVAALQQARGVDPSIDVAGRIERLQQRAAVATLPEEYRAIPSNPRLTRGELAALVGLRLEALVAAAKRPSPPLVNDVRGHWAATWILAVARAGIMEPFSNHGFQPRAVVRRGDLAVVVSRILAVIGTRDKAAAAKWSAARTSFADVGSGHAQYPAASMAVAAGVLAAAEGQAFQIGRAVSGAEAIEALTRLEALARRAGLAGDARR